VVLFGGHSVYEMLVVLFGGHSVCEMQALELWHLCCFCTDVKLYL